MNKSVTIELQGSLGNQLFQLATGFTFADMHQKNLQIFTNEHINYFDNIFKNFQQERKLIRPQVESNLVYREKSKDIFRFIKLADTIEYLYGCFQNELFFKSHRDQFIKRLDLSTDLDLLSKYDKLDHSYFLYIGGGDYFQKKKMYIHPAMEHRYYVSAVLDIHKRDPDAHFYVFTDDLSYCNRILKFLQQTILYTVVREDTVNSLILMSRCRLGGICANSSFSWWGGYLNPNPDKKIWYPDWWLGRTMVLKSQRIYPACPSTQIIRITRKPRFVFVIYTCQAKLLHAKKLYDSINGKIRSDLCIVIGDETIDTEYKIELNDTIGEEVIRLNCPDDYVNLSKKTLAMFKSIPKIYPNCRGIFKCDDDMKINPSNLNNFIETLEKKRYLYCGSVIVKYKGTDRHRIERFKHLNIDRIQVPSTKYCGGPLYYIDTGVLSYFDHPDMFYHYYEDLMVGHNLLINGIRATHINFLFRHNITLPKQIGTHDLFHK